MRATCFTIEHCIIEAVYEPPHGGWMPLTPALRTARTRTLARVSPRRALIAEHVLDIVLGVGVIALLQVLPGEPAAQSHDGTPH
jgi:hypothetical protein